MNHVRALKLGEAIHSAAEGEKFPIYEDDDTPIPMRDRRTRVSIDERDALVFDVDHETVNEHEDRITEFANRSARASRTNLTDEDSGDHEHTSDNQRLLNGLSTAPWHGAESSEKEPGIGDKAGIILASDLFRIFAALILIPFCWLGYPQCFHRHTAIPGHRTSFSDICVIRT